MLGDVAAEVLWASTTLGGDLGATNIWIGNERSVSGLHSDDYENMFCQITGRKRFVLVSPYEAICLQEALLPAATYAPHPRTRELRIVPEDPDEDVHYWPTVDPDLPPESKWWPHCRPLEVVLEPGDVRAHTHSPPPLPSPPLRQKLTPRGRCCISPPCGTAKSRRRCRTTGSVALLITGRFSPSRRVGGCNGNRYNMDFSAAFFAGISFAQQLSRLAIREDEANAARAIVNGVH